MKKPTIAISLFFALAIAFTGCREENSAKEKMEEGIEKIEEGAEEAGDEIEDGVDEIEDEIDDHSRP